jgi:hypothetical protein
LCVQRPVIGRERGTTRKAHAQGKIRQRISHGCRCFIMRSNHGSERIFCRVAR